MRLSNLIVIFLLLPLFAVPTCGADAGCPMGGGEPASCHEHGPQLVKPCCCTSPSTSAAHVQAGLKNLEKMPSRVLVQSTFRGPTPPRKAVTSALREVPLALELDRLALFSVLVI